jgi:hypothetical protein
LFMWINVRKYTDGLLAALSKPAAPTTFVPTPGAVPAVQPSAPEASSSY